MGISTDWAASSPGWTDDVLQARTWDGLGLLVCLLLLGALASVGYLVHDSSFSFAAAPAAAPFLSSIFVQWESEYHDWTEIGEGKPGNQDVDLLPRTNDEPHGLLHAG